MSRTPPNMFDANFDPFGEPVADGILRSNTTTAGDRAARRFGGAVFWSLVLLILAGRIYASETPVMQTVAAYTGQVVAVR